MDDAEKLAVLLEHWIEHNASHREEFEKWAKRAGKGDLEAVSGEIAAAADRLQDADSCLQRALTHLRSKT